MIKVVLDGYFLAKPRGMGRYVQELLYALGRYADNDFQFFAIVPKELPDKYHVMPERIEYLRVAGAPFPLWEQWRLPREINRIRPNVAHFPYNTSPLAFHHERTGRVVTIHDLLYMDGGKELGGSLYQKFGNRYRKMVVGAYKSHAQHVVTDSYRSAEEIQTRLGLSSDVVYIPTEYGYGECAQRAKLTTSPLTPRYFLHVGGLSPHKNTERCIKAFLSLEINNSALVVTGLPNDCDLAKKYQNERVIFPGWLSDDAMARYYVHAQALLFPSLAEGYGLPIIEAFTVGIPVITSNLTPMSELANGAALLVNPYSEAELAQAMSDIANNEELRKRLIAQGEKQLYTINGKNMAATMSGIYRKASK